MQNNKCILLITSSYPSNSDDIAGAFILDYIEEFKKQNVNVIVLTQANKKEFKKTEEQIDVIRFPWRNQSNEPLAYFSFLNLINIFFLIFNGVKYTRKILNENKIDVILCLWIIPSGLYIYLLKLFYRKRIKTPYLVWALGSDIWKIRQIPILGRFLLKNVINNSLVSYADGIQLCKDSEEISGKKCEFLSTSRLLRNNNNSKIELLPKDKKHFLFVGRFHKNKGPDILIEAISKISKDKLNFLHLHMFGLGPMESALKELIVKNNLDNYITFNGIIQADELSKYLYSVSFLIIPSRIESIPVIFSDAMQCNTPVISTPTGDLPELISKYGCGILAKEITSEALALAIEEGLNYNRDDFLEQTKNMYQKFSINKNVSKLIETINTQFTQKTHVQE